MRTLTRAVAVVALATAALSGLSCGAHSSVECDDRIPCPDGMTCSPDGICLLVLPADSGPDARVILDAGPDARPDVISTECGDGVCLGGETCLNCPADCGDCPFSCGDGFCEPGVGEDCENCRVDCGPCPIDCGDGLCALGESCVTCELDCGPCTGCDHSVCEVGAPLSDTCDACAATVCSIDPFCCVTFWDDICVDEAVALCLVTCADRCGDGFCEAGAGESCETCDVDCGPCGSCEHDKCVVGGPLAADCDTCVTAICAVDPFCCTSGWDGICVNEVTTICGEMCAGGFCGDGLCAPDGTEDCMICPADCGPCGGCGDGVCNPFEFEDCSWCPIDCGVCPPGCGDGICNVLAGEDCSTCSPDCGFCSMCGDGFCDLFSGEDCASCSLDCGTCTNCGDMICGPGETNCTCSIDCGPCSCDHDLCEPGGPLVASCDMCVAAICAVDPFCCTSGWDGICVNEVITVCGLSCGGGGGCGDGLCSAGESCTTCPSDCGVCPGVCGDGICSIGEDCATCALDCGTCGGMCPDEFLAPFVPQTVTGSTIGAGNEWGGASCGGGGGAAPEVTYVFVAPSSGDFTFDTVGSGYDTLLYIRDGNACTGDELACNDDTPGVGVSSRVTVALVAGQQVSVFVDGWSGSQGSYVLSITGPTGACGDGACTAGEDCVSCPTDCGPCPPGCGDGMCSAIETCSTCPIDCGPCPPTCGNMTCDPGETCSSCPGDCGACPPVCVDQDLGSIVPQSVSGSTAGAGNDLGGASCGGGGAAAPELVYELTAPSTNTFRIDTAGSSYDTLLYVRDGTCTGAQLACNDDTPGLGTSSRVDVPLMSGQTVVIVVDGFGSSSGAFNLNIAILGASCGDMFCSPTETCSSCPTDCGPCPPGCPNGVCTPTETCATCPADCGVCPPTCGNMTCDAGETCATCAIDCGVCPGTCGDGACTAGSGETCTTCPVDCGACPGCDHSPCEIGSALDPSCDMCAATVCAVDPFCCTVSWDGACVSEAVTMCGSTCPGTCGDFVCSGSETCSTCPADCGACPTVCPNGTCEPGEGCLTCPADCGVCPGTCGNGLCDAGETCASCASDCGTCTGTCSHDECVTGAALVDGCSMCVTSVCAVDPFCCNTSWDGLCAGEAASICGEPCDASCGNGTCGRGETCATCPMDCGACVCPHDVCTPGVPLPATCSACVAAVCAIDPFCCTSDWDDRCISEAESECGISCGGSCGDGTCGPGENCTNCTADCGPCPSPCGDGFCTGSETCATCPGDCGPCPVCGDGSCVFPEDCFSCALDCGSCGFCGDMFCDAFAGEDCFTCSIDCGSCGFCGDMVCDGFAGEDCTTCDIDCGVCPPVCGDGFCAPGENCFGCPGDCGPCGTCGDGFCVAILGEDCMSCPADCGACGSCGNGVCGAGEACWSCPADCGGCLVDCGDGDCVPQQAEFCFTCPADCGPCGGP